MDDYAPFARLVQVLEPWRGHLVLVGGWAHRLYRFHPMATVPIYRPLLTRDTDLAFADGAPMEGDIRTALITAGFTEELTGEHKPPVSRYTLGDDDGGFFTEFLTPLRGSGVKRGGKPNATLLKAGITAQKLRHLEILLLGPWQITVGPDQGVPLPKRTDLQVANPVSFIAQKLLIHDVRPPAKRAQDVLYIHDAIELFSGALPALNKQWYEVVRPSLDEQTASQIVELSHRLFSTVTDTVRDAARIPQDRILRPELLRATCELGLSRILG